MVIAGASNPVSIQGPDNRSPSNDIQASTTQETILPGFRFHPTDEELVGFYLRCKVMNKPLAVEVITQLDIYKFDPWDLPKMSAAGSKGEKDCYFFCPRDRKYRNSARPNRVTGAGFWKATGTDRPIYSSKVQSGSGEMGPKCIGLKKSLVFYKGRAAKGVKTDWMMHEFRLPSDQDPSSVMLQVQHEVDRPGQQQRDAWALCRIFKKSTLAHRSMALFSGNISDRLEPSSSDVHHLVEYFGASTSSKRMNGMLRNFQAMDPESPPAADQAQISDSDNTKELSAQGAVSNSAFGENDLDRGDSCTSNESPVAPGGFAHNLHNLQPNGAPAELRPTTRQTYNYGAGNREVVRQTEGHELLLHHSVSAYLNKNENLYPGQPGGPWPVDVGGRSINSLLSSQTGEDHINDNLQPGSHLAQLRMQILQQHYADHAENTDHAKESFEKKLPDIGQQMAQMSSASQLQSQAHGAPAPEEKKEILSDAMQRWARMPSSGGMMGLDDLTTLWGPESPGVMPSVTTFMKDIGNFGYEPEGNQDRPPSSLSTCNSSSVEATSMEKNRPNAEAEPVTETRPGPQWHPANNYLYNNSQSPSAQMITSSMYLPTSNSMMNANMDLVSIHRGFSLPSLHIPPTHYELQHPWDTISPLFDNFHAPTTQRDLP